MKKMSLRVSIVILLVTLTLTFGALLLAYETAAQHRNLQQKALTDMHATLKHLQLLSESALDHGDYSFIEQEIGFLGVEPEIENLSLLDPQGKIVLSSQAALKYTLAEQTLQDFDAQLFKDITASHEPEIREAADRNIYFGYFPVHFPYRQNGNLSEGSGAFYVRYNYSQPAATLFFNAVNDSAILLLGFMSAMLLLYFILYRWTLAPLHALVHNIREVQGPQTLAAQDGEWAVLNNAFNHLTEMLADDDKKLQIQKVLYNILSETDQSIVRIKDKHNLCSEICQIAVRHGHFVLVWIGFIDANSGNLEICAKAGPAQHALDDFNPLEYFQAEHGNTDTILKRLESGESFINNNCTASAAGKSRQAGGNPISNSCAVFPIIQFGRLDGVFAIYAEQKNFFSSDIVKLLKEMATDLSFAIEIMHLDTLRKNTEQALKEREENLSVTLHSIGDGFITTDTIGRVTRMNYIAEQLTGWSMREAEYMPIEDVFNIIDVHTHNPAESPVRKALAKGDIVKLASHVALLSKSGQEYKIADSAAPIRDTRQQIIGVVLVFHDITKQYAITAELKESEERFRHVNEATGGYIWETDTEGYYTYLSDQAIQVKGRTPKELLGTSMYEYITEEDAQKVHEAIANADPDNNKFHLTIRNIGPSGETLWEEMQAIVIWDETGRIKKIRGAGVSITERVKAEAEIKHLAYYDALTDLPNRRLLIDNLKRAVASAKRRNTFGALLFFDLDRFKNLNDSMGHDAGDELLRTIALRLKEMIREEDTAARLGGDEFVVLLTDLGDTWEAAGIHTRTITEKIQTVLRAPYRIKDFEYINSCSIGITLFPQHPDVDAETLLKQADTALYRAKDSGRDTMQFFHPEMQRAALERLEIDKTLRSALAEDRLQIYYQPQYNSNGELLGIEALLRCPAGDDGTMPAADFLAIAEESGLIVPMGRWLLNTACKQFKHWLDAGIIGHNRHLCINVSPKQFKHDNFIGDIENILLSTGLDASLLLIEVTEKLFDGDFPIVADKMRKLHDLGIKVAVDDFGTGYTSLARLKGLPLCQLKIDNSFIEQIEKDSDDRMIIETIIAMGRYLAISILAEGVETKEQLQFLKAKGCHNYQGFYFSQPLDAAAFETFLKEHRKAA